MTETRIDAKMALARYESSYAAFGVEACFTLKGLRDVQRYIEQLEAELVLAKCHWARRDQWCATLDCKCLKARKVLEEKDD